MRSRVGFASRNERTTVAVGTRSRPAVRGVLLHDLDALVHPRRGFEALGVEVGHMTDDLLLQEVRDDDAQRRRRPFGGADERATQLDRIEERRAGAAPPELEDPQFAPTSRELERDAELADEIDAELGERRAPAEIGDASGPGREERQIAARAGAIEMALFRLELVRLHERLGPHRIGVGVRESSVGREPVAHRESGVGRLVGEPLAARVLAGETPVAEVVGPAEHRRGDPWRLIDVHVSHGTGRLGHHSGIGARRYTHQVRIVIGADHAGFSLKQHLIPVLKEWGHDVEDLGTHSEEPVDYPPICAAVGRVVVAGDADLGIVLGGSGQGEQIAANKVRGVRAALCHDLFTARLARMHNDANVLSMGGRIVAPPLAEEILRVFLETGFEGGRHVARLEEIARIEAGEEA
jgi:ribose 5-phosphate isomerase B